MHLLNEPLPKWQTTRLWKELEGREGNLSFSRTDLQTAQTVLLAYMPIISGVLEDAGTGVEDFTLHDASHAWRVAERMVDVLPPDLLGALSTAEVALLLFAAHLHDIGMSPGRAKVTQYRNYLLTGEWTVVRDGKIMPDTISDDDKDHYVDWLMQHTELTAKSRSRDEISASLLGDVDKAVALYCRDQHNAWSAAWIRENMEGAAKLYNGWLEDLVLLCKSHHYGYDALRRDDFNPHLIPNTNEVVHLRYLACVLRVADVIEFDPERTPEVIFHHRGVAPTSRVFWWKDQVIAWMIEQGRLTINAQPSDAGIHRAVELTVIDVERELRLCRRIADEMTFTHMAGHSPLPHHWHLDIAVHADIRPRNAAYQYINGAFRPNTRKVLELLGGLDLYGNQLAAVRELLQNAFDSVREQIARQQLADIAGSTREFAASLTQIHSVSLRLEMTSNGLNLVCTDTGAGMSREIIERCFLVSGESYRPDIDRLRRRCEEANISYLRSGQFGIGVLSYFMLADRVILKTRRSLEAGEADTAGWRFETEGVGSFGELRPYPGWAKGTEVRLCIRQESYKDNGQEFSASISDFICETVSYIPCRFDFSSTVSSCDSFSRNPGWFLRPGDLTDQLFDGLSDVHQDSSQIDLVPKKQSREIEAERDALREVHRDCKARLRWSTVESEIPNRSARIRIHIPWFELPNGACLAYFQPDAESDPSTFRYITGLGDSFGLFPETNVSISWRGMAVSIQYSQRSSFPEDVYGLCGYVEIDFLSSDIGHVSVQRQDLQLYEAGIDVLRQCLQKHQQEILKWISEEGTTNWRLINLRLSGAKGDVTDDKTPKCEYPQQWFFSDRSDTTFRLEPIAFPTTLSIQVHNKKAPYPLQTLNGTPISSTEVFHVTKLRQPIRTREWNRWFEQSGMDLSYYTALTPGFSPEGRLRISTHWLSDKDRLTAIPVWSLCDIYCDVLSPLPVSEFPPSWRTLIGCTCFAGSLIEYELWNRDNPVVRKATPHDMEWAHANENPIPFQDTLLADPNKAASWLISLIQSTAYQEEIVDIWRAINERDPNLLRAIIDIAVGEKVEDDSRNRLLFFSNRSRRSGVGHFLVLSPTKASLLPPKKVLGSLLPDLDGEWQIRMAE